MPRILLNERGHGGDFFFLWKIALLPVDTGSQFVFEVSQ